MSAQAARGEGLRGAGGDRRAVVIWLITTQGFYSVVQHQNIPNLLLVRARQREDLEALKRNQLPDLQILHDRRADYPWRAIVNRHVWRSVAAALAADINYPNFKNAVKERQGPERAGIYARVWSDLTRLEQLADETPPMHHPV